MSSSSSRKRTIDSFFNKSTKKTRLAELGQDRVDVQPSGDNAGSVNITSSDILINSTLASVPESSKEFSVHPTYPFSIAQLPSSISFALASLPNSTGKVITEQPDLDLLHFQPYLPKNLRTEVFHFLRKELPFYRVEYSIKRGGVETRVNTPRYTTVFGLDDSSYFSPTGTPTPKNPSKPAPKYQQLPRPIPKCLDDLRLSTEAATKSTFNFCLVNYYASGLDSISYHSDDERFLGPDPCIASFSLGARRDFLLKHKTTDTGTGDSKLKMKEELKPLKFPLGSGDMILMRGLTQANWLHSIPKRSRINAEDGGRINITFRKTMIPAGTDNYYHYNVGTGPVYKWDDEAKEMRLWKYSK